MGTWVLSQGDRPPIPATGRRSTLSEHRQYSQSLNTCAAPLLASGRPGKGTLVEQEKYTAAAGLASAVSWQPLNSLAMPRHDSDNLAETFAKILCERASFELKEDDVHAYRQHISSLQQAAQFTAAAKASEEEAYRQWVVRYLLLKCAQRTSSVMKLSFSACHGAAVATCLSWHLCHPAHFSGEGQH